MTAGFFEKVRMELLKIYEGLDTEDETARLKKECADWKRLAKEREDAHDQGYREGRALANLRIAEMKQDFETLQECYKSLARDYHDDLEKQCALLRWFMDREPFVRSMFDVGSFAGFAVFEKDNPKPEAAS